MNWNDKFSGKEYSYGTEPNDFLRSVADKIKAANGLVSDIIGKRVQIAQRGLFGIHGVRAGGDSRRVTAQRGSLAERSTLQAALRRNRATGQWCAVERCTVHGTRYTEGARTGPEVTDL